MKPREVSDWQSEKGNQRKCESKRKKNEGKAAERNSARAQWDRTAENRDVSTGPLARPFVHSLSLLTPELVGI